MVAPLLMIASGVMQSALLSFFGQRLWREPNKFTLFTFSALIVGSGFMVQGYSLLDKLIAVSLVVIGLVRLKGWAEASARLPVDVLSRAHALAFHLFLAYMTLQTLRGAIKLEDPAVLRFLLLFVGLGVMARMLTLRGQPGRTWDRIHADNFVRAILASAVIYVVLYVLVGFVMENLYGLNRFTMQGAMWVGTTAAMLAVFVALAALPARRDLPFRHVAAVYALLLLCAFYYQSRLAWVALLLFVPLTWSRWGHGNSALLSVMFLGFVYVFPWHATANLTVSRALKIVHEEWSGPSEDVLRLVRLKTGRFLSTTTGGKMSPEEIAITQAPANLGDATAGGQVEPEAPVMLAGDPNAQDQDRIISIAAVVQYLRDGGWTRVLWGEGMFTHRTNLIGYVEDESKKFHFVMPESYHRVVRSATTNLIAADGGLFGLALWISLFGVCALRSFLLSGRSLVPVFALGMVGLSTLVAQNYEMILLYVLLMPNGLLVHLAEAYSPERADGVESTCMRTVA